MVPDSKMQFGYPNEVVHALIYCRLLEVISHETEGVRPIRPQIAHLCPNDHESEAFDAAFSALTNSGTIVPSFTRNLGCPITARIAVMA